MEGRIKDASDFVSVLRIFQQMHYIVFGNHFLIVQQYDLSVAGKHWFIQTMFDTENR